MPISRTSYVSMSAWLSIASTCFVLGGCSHLGTEPTGDQLYSFELIGGHFYGPGPIVPDTALPDGRLRNIKFDIPSFSGYALFESDGHSRLSDGKTRINRNIDAGRLMIGDGDHPVLLVAVDGGSNQGREYYRLNSNYELVWTVDLALDPGFADGIIRVDDFLLTTGVIPIQLSEQSEHGIPGGYDQAGSLRSGQYLAGRIGDYDQDGYMDGVVVASPRVPLSSNMLPGSPVGNQRGFKTDVPIAEHIACELTIRSISHFEEPLEKLISENASTEDILEMLTNIRERISVARLNMDRALLSGTWGASSVKQDGFKLADRLETLRLLNFIAVSFLTDYPTHSGQISEQVKFTIEQMFDQAESLAHMISEVNTRTGLTLPDKKGNNRV